MGNRLEASGKQAFMRRMGAVSVFSAYLLAGTCLAGLSCKGNSARQAASSAMVQAPSRAEELNAAITGLKGALALPEATPEMEEAKRLAVRKSLAGIGQNFRESLAKGGAGRAAQAYKRNETTLAGYYGSPGLRSIRMLMSASTESFIEATPGKEDVWLGCMFVLLPRIPRAFTAPEFEPQTPFQKAIGVRSMDTEKGMVTQTIGFFAASSPAHAGISSVLEVWATSKDPFATRTMEELFSSMASELRAGPGLSP